MIVAFDLVRQVGHTMDIRPIRTDDDHEEALREVDRLWGAEHGTAEGDKLDVLLVLVNEYEERRWPPEPASPRDILEFAVEEMGCSQKELPSLLGSRSLAAEAPSSAKTCRQTTLTGFARRRVRASSSLDLTTGTVMIDPTARRRVLDAVYGAAIDTGRWPEALTLVADAIGATGGMIAFHPLRAQDGFQIVGRLREDLSDLYMRAYTGNPIEIAMRAAPRNRAIMPDLASFILV